MNGYALLGYLVRDYESSDMKQYNEKKNIIINVNQLVFIRPNYGQIKFVMVGGEYFLMDVRNPNEVLPNVLQRINAL